MSEKQGTSPIEPEAVGKIAYWKKQLHLLAEPGVILMIVGVAIFSWNLSGWHKAGVIETTKAELALSKARLDDSVADANQAIEQMKKLGLALVAPITDELAMSGRIFQYIHLKYKLERVAKIADTLKKLGASQEEMDKACSTIYARVTNDHIRKILHSLKSSNPGKEELFEGINDGKMDDWDKGKIETFIRENNLNKSEEADEWLLDLDYFLKQRKLRREDKWQS